MKPYASIPSESPLGQHCYGFVKYDGSNLRFEWSKKKGWYKFGTRTRLFDESDPEFGSAIALFKAKYGSGCEKVFRELHSNCDSVIVYGEFFGAQSFAGKHVQDDEKDIVIIDVNPHKKGLIAPKTFFDTFGHLGVAEVCYEGLLTDEIIQACRDGDPALVESRRKIKTAIPEGVVWKGGSGHSLWMSKTKTAAWLEQLKTLYPSNWETMQ